MSKKVKSNGKATISIDVENTSSESKEKFNWWKFGVLAFLVIAAFIGGLFLGRKIIPPITLPPEYTPADTIKIEVPTPYPVSVKEPADTADIIAECVATGKYWELFPEKVRDSLIYMPTSQDTLDIVRDWATERMYEEKIFDVDTIGTATIKAKTQYNRLTVLSAEVVPVIKNVPYVVPPKKFEPFAGAGFNTASSLMVSGGAFVNGKWGGLLTYQRDFNVNKDIVGAQVIYKF